MELLFLWVVSMALWLRSSHLLLVVGAIPRVIGSKPDCVSANFHTHTKHTHSKCLAGGCMGSGGIKCEFH